MAIVSLTDSMIYANPAGRQLNWWLTAGSAC